MLFTGGLNGGATGSLGEAEVQTGEDFAIVPGHPRRRFLRRGSFRWPAPMTWRDSAYEPSARGASRSLTRHRASTGALTCGAIGAADVLVIPFIPEPFAADGALGVLDVIRTFPDADPTVMTVATMVEHGGPHRYCP